MLGGWFVHLATILLIQHTTESSQPRGAIPIRIDDEDQNFFFSSENDEIRDQANRFCETFDIETTHSSSIELRANEYVRSMKDASKDDIRIIRPSYAETLYSHSTDPYVQIDLVLSSEIAPNPERYEVQIFTTKDKVLSLPFDRKILEDRINIYISNELFGTYYLEVRIFDRDRSRVIQNFEIFGKNHWCCLIF